MFLSYTLCYNHQMLSVVSFGSLPSLPPSFSLEVSFCPEYSVNQSSLLLLQTPAPLQLCVFNSQDTAMSKQEWMWMALAGERFTPDPGSEQVKQLCVTQRVVANK